MSGNFVSLRSWQALDCETKWLNGAGYRLFMKSINKKLSKLNTYMLIFGKGQDELMQQFIEQAENNGINILHVSKKAINRTAGHGFEPRNALVVWEFKDD